MSRARIAQLRALYDQHHGAMNTITDRAAAENRERLNADEETQLRGHEQALDAINPELEALIGRENRAAQMDALNAGVLLGGAGWVNGDGTVYGAAPESGADVPPLLPSGVQLREMFAAHQGNEPVQRRWELETRAAITLSTTGTTSGELAVSPAREPRRIATAAGLPVEEVNGVGGTVFPIFLSTDSAAVTAEGAVKPEYDSITTGTAVPAVIAIWTDHTRQVSETITTFDQRLRAKLAARVARAEDALLVARVLAAPGIQTYQAPTTSTPYADSLLAAAALVAASDVAAEPSLALLNPADVVKVFGGTAVGPGGMSPDTELRLRLHGMDVYVTNTVAAGAALVGAWSSGSYLVLGSRPRVLVDTMSQLKSNKITTLLEETVTLAVTDPEAFVSVDLNGP